MKALILLIVTLVACGADPAKPVDDTAVAKAATPAKPDEVKDPTAKDKTTVEQGADGARGDKGDKGDTGAQGERGDKGEKGEKGDKGDAGTVGVDGNDGKDGAIGAQGSAGAQGVAGSPGIQGDIGATGATGAVGAAGINGSQGIQGISGIDGATGATGAAGIQGIKGADGATGAAGQSFAHLSVRSDSDEEIGDLIDFGVSQEWLVFRPASTGVPALRFDLDRGIAAGRISASFGVYFTGLNCTGSAYVPAGQVIWINVHAVGDTGQAWVISDKAATQTVNYNSALSSGGSCTNTTVSSTARWYSASLITLPFSYPVAYAYLTQDEG